MMAGLKRSHTMHIEGRWPIKGPWPTVSEIIDLAKILEDNDVGLGQPIRLEPAGNTLAGDEPACFVLQAYKVEEG